MWVYRQTESYLRDSRMQKYYRYCFILQCSLHVAYVNHNFFCPRLFLTPKLRLHNFLPFNFQYLMKHQQENSLLDFTIETKIKILQFYLNLKTKKKQRRWVVMFKVSFSFFKHWFEVQMRKLYLLSLSKTLKYQFYVLSISEFACDTLDGKGNVQLSSKSILFKKIHPAVIVSGWRWHSCALYLHHTFSATNEYFVDNCSKKKLGMVIVIDI